MTQIHAIAIKSDSVLSIDGSLYFVEPSRIIDEKAETVTYALRPIGDDGSLSNDLVFQRFDFEDLVTLKG